MVKFLNEGISILTACMDRNYNIIKNIKNWTQFNEVNQIIIIDWNSTNEVYYDLLNNNLLSPKIKIIRVLNQPKWILSYAFNVGLQFIRYNKLLKIDSDIYLSPDFFQKNKINTNSFISGNWKTAKNENELHLNGQIFCYTQHILSINGYNEFITTYGFDDCDLYKRLELNNLFKNDFHDNTIFHIENTNEERIKNQNINDIDYEIIKNSIISEKFPWDSSKKMIEIHNTKFINDFYTIIDNVSCKYNLNPDFLIEAKSKIEFGFLIKKIRNYIPNQLIPKLYQIPQSTKDIIKNKILNNQLEQTTYFNNNLKFKKYNIAFLIPIISKNIDEINNSIFYKNTLPTIQNLYLESNQSSYSFNFTLYFGFDENDIIFDNFLLQQKFKKNCFLQLHPKINIKFFKVNQPNSHNPVSAWNELFKIAIAHNNDYFYQIGDDIINTKPNSILNYIAFLENNNNIGLCGPLDLTYPSVFTQTFVSKKHFEIFNTYFDRTYKNWYCDDWITSVYPDELKYVFSFCFNEISKPRYNIFEIEKSNHEINIEKGISVFKNYISDEVNIIKEKYLKKEIIGYEKDENQSFMEQRKNEILKRKKELLSNKEIVKIDFSIVCVSNKIHLLSNIIKNFENQKHVNKELIIIINSKQPISPNQQSIINGKNYKIKFFIIPNKSLGECLNYGAKIASGKYFVKFDDDDFYLPNYLTEAYDILNKNNKINIIGKGACSIFIPERNKYYLRYESVENDFCNKIYGGTIICKNSILLKYKFDDISLGEDSAWLGRVIKSGLKVYSSSCRNYIYTRSLSNKNHTWKIDMNEFLKTCFDIPKQLQKDLSKNHNYKIETI